MFDIVFQNYFVLEMKRKKTDTMCHNVIIRVCTGIACRVLDKFPQLQYLWECSSAWNKISENALNIYDIAI